MLLASSPLSTCDEWDDCRRRDRVFVDTESIESNWRSCTHSMFCFLYLSLVDDAKHSLFQFLGGLNPTKLNLSSTNTLFFLQHSSYSKLFISSFSRLLGRARLTARIYALVHVSHSRGLVLPLCVTALGQSAKISHDNDNIFRLPDRVSDPRMVRADLPEA